jgi:large subunit ribosomal protein L7/L12
MAKTSTEKLLEKFEEMTVLELSEFLKAFEEKFDVTAAAPVAVAVAAAGGDAGGEVAEEQDEFNVVLTGAGEKKIQVIKEVRALTSLGLKTSSTQPRQTSLRVLTRKRPTRPRRPSRPQAPT